MSNADSGSYSSKVDCLATAIDRLGEHHDPQDVPLLISYLAFARPSKHQDPYITMHPTPPEHGYPAIEALARQGESARTPLLNYIGVAVDSLKRHNATYAFVSIKALEPASSILQLKERRQSGQSDVASRFDDAITFAKTIWPCKKTPTSCEKASSDK